MTDKEVELIDKFRSLSMTINAWVYHRDDPDGKIEEFTKTYTEEEDGPFEEDREQWQGGKLEKIIRDLTGDAIALFGRYGITGPAGGEQETTSFNWAFEIEETIFEFKPGCPQFILDQIEYLEREYEKAETESRRQAIEKELNRLKEKCGL